MHSKLSVKKKSVYALKAVVHFRSYISVFEETELVYSSNISNIRELLCYWIKRETMFTTKELFIYKNVFTAWFVLVRYETTVLLNSIIPSSHSFISLFEDAALQSDVHRAAQHWRKDRVWLCSVSWRVITLFLSCLINVKSFLKLLQINVNP